MESRHRPILRILFFLALAANSLDLVATALGIHWFGNGEGNPLLADMVNHRWWEFVAFKGLFVPVLIIALYLLRWRSPRLAGAALAIVTLAFTVAVGQWLGWMAGVLAVSGVPGL